jgi:hypothetical protein
MELAKTSSIEKRIGVESSGTAKKTRSTENANESGYYGLAQK